ncbi:MAG: lipo-like protein, partial [Candidatus Puniceispirillum sp.]|nr:lipo-like protein [Candidatus Puniceispirillum sp.]
RYLIATPPVPSRYRRSLIAFGSGDPTKAICSTLVAQSFQSIKYPILPRELSVQEKKRFYNDQLVMQKRHYSHFTPRDFDLSPYFQIIKPTISNDFDYQDIKWDE